MPKSSCLKSLDIIRRNAVSAVFKIVSIFALIFSILIPSIIVVILTGYIQKVYALGDVTEEWSFDVPGDYSVSDSNLIEISDNAVRLKTRNYASDADTAGLYHFDEATGLISEDASSYSNDGVVTNAEFDVDGGILDGGLLFKGGTAPSQVLIGATSPSSSLYLNQAHTLEGWVKFNDDFDSSLNNKKMSIIDRGNYQLYFDDESGKLTYELSPSTATSWVQAGGGNAITQGSINDSWDLNGKPQIASLTTFYDTEDATTYVYAGTGASVSDAEVWRYSSSTSLWTKIGGDAVGWDDNTYEEVTAMDVDSNGDLYVGLGLNNNDAEVWKYTASSVTPSWSKIGGDGTGATPSTLGWAQASPGPYEVVYSLLHDGTYLYAGLGSSSSDAEVWRYDGTQWEKIGGDSFFGGWAAGFDGVFSLAHDGTHLYAGLGVTAGEAEVWVWNGTDDWDKIGGDGTGWADNTYEAVLALYVQDGFLYAGLGTGTNDSDVFKYDISTPGWSQVGGNGVGWADGGYDRVSSITGNGTDQVYFGMGLSAQDSDVYVYNGSTTTKIGGDGTGWPANNSFIHVRALAYGSNSGLLYAGVSQSAGSGEVYAYDDSTWTNIGGNYKNKSWGYYGLNSIESMAVEGSYLYAGTGRSINTATHIQNAQVWRFDGSSWGDVPIGGMGINGSWSGSTIEHEYVHSLAGFNGKIYAGLGNSAGDGEVWEFDGVDDWDLIGGDGAGWSASIDAVNVLMAYENYLYAGLGNSTGEGIVYRYDGSNWTNIGGGSSNWGTGNNAVLSMTVYRGNIVVGLGTGADDAEVWEYNGSTWIKIGGDATNSSWSHTTADYDEVFSLAVYKGELYAGLGSTTGEAEVWKFDGSAWSQVGGDGTGTSPNTLGWDQSYERVRALTVYNGELYAALGDTATEAEVWKYDGIEWTKIGGDGEGWGVALEFTNALQPYKGKLYAGQGLTANADATIWAYGGNHILQSTQSSWTAGQWYHYAAVFTGSEMRLKVTPLATGITTTDTLSNSFSLSDNNLDLLIGNSYGSNSENAPSGYLEGYLDEIRISKTNRSSFVTTPYTSSAQTAHINSAVFTEDIASYADDGGFSVTDNGQGTIKFRLSDNNGSSWKYFNTVNSAWEVSSDAYTQSNSESEIETNIGTFPVTSSGIKWQAVLKGNGNERPSMSYVEVQANSDTLSPDPPTSISVYDESGGSEIILEEYPDPDPLSNEWFPHSEPFFSWTASIDNGDSGVAGYWVYFGPDSDGDPVEDGEFQAETTYIPDSLTSGEVYYIRIQAQDNAQNLSEIYSPNIYRFDNTGPNVPSIIEVDPYINSENEFEFSWSDIGIQDCVVAGECSGLAGYQYKTSGTGPYSGWSSTITGTTAPLSGAAYQNGVNYFYLRTIDFAGNTSPSSVQSSFVYAQDAPSAPRNLNIFPVTTPDVPSSTNSFTFSWNSPSTFNGSANTLRYCITLNQPPPDNLSESNLSANCDVLTTAGVTSAGPDAFATNPNANIVYVVAVDSVGNVNPSAAVSGNFYVSTESPGIPQTLEIADVSVKSTSSWKLALSWEAPTVGTVANYEVYRSTDQSTYSKVGTVPSISFVDTGLDQETYYYKVRACDSTNNCGAFTSIVSMMPTGRFTDAATLSSDPVVSDITTKKATITWVTNRESDSKVQYGTSSDEYYDEEPSNSDQVTEHVIVLNNLEPGTSYYFLTKWTDEDGNTGLSEELEFKTLPAPTVTDPKLKVIGINNITLEFTVSGAEKARIYYGESAAFGGTYEIATSTDESAYSVTIDSLKEGTKYFYKINTFDIENSEYEGNVLSFETLPRPRIDDAKIQQVKGTAQPTLLVTWITNTEVSGIVTYYPTNNPGETKDEVNISLQKGKHRMLLKNLLPNTDYTLIITGRDRSGNEARSDVFKISTSEDTRAPLISDIKIEGNIVTAGSGSEATKMAQLVVSWSTDEAATSQVEFGEGTGSIYSQKTQEDNNKTFTHIVVISNLTPSKVYHLRAISKDAVGNETKSIDSVTIAPKATDDALDLVISNLSEVFGFLNNIR